MLVHYPHIGTLVNLTPFGNWSVIKKMTGQETDEETREPVGPAMHFIVYVFGAGHVEQVMYPDEKTRDDHFDHIASKMNESMRPQGKQILTPNIHLR